MKTTKSTQENANKRAYTVEQETNAQNILASAEKSYYDVLSIRRSATDDDIKKAYRKLALRFHPDKNAAPSSVSAFKVINEAMDCLSNPIKRESYDAYGHKADADNNFSNKGFRGNDTKDISPQALAPQVVFKIFYQNYNCLKERRGLTVCKESTRFSVMYYRIMTLLGIGTILLLISFFQAVHSVYPSYSLHKQGEYLSMRLAGSGTYAIKYYVRASNIPSGVLRNAVESAVWLDYRDISARRCLAHTFMANLQGTTNGQKNSLTEDADSCLEYSTIYLDQS